MATDYPFDIATFFPGVDIFCSVLLSQSQVAGLTKINNVTARTKSNPTDVVFTSDPALTAGEVTALGTVVSSYQEELGTQNEVADLFTRIWSAPQPARKLAKSEDAVFFEAGHGFSSVGAGTVSDLSVGDDRAAPSSWLLQVRLQTLWRETIALQEPRSTWTPTTL
jgi:hypothetical protein